MKKEPEVRTLGAGKFKATCLQLMDQVADTKLTIIITKRGKPIAQLSAPTTDSVPTKPAAEKSPKKTMTSGSAPVPAAPETSSSPTPGKHSKKKDKGKKKKHK